MNKEKEYLRRNQIHAKAVGVYYGIDSALSRLSNLKRKPKWLIKLLDKEHAKAYEVQKEIAAHREEMKEGRAAILGRLRNALQQPQECNAVKS